MPNYRRFYVPGGQYFFTVVTAQRRRIMTEPSFLNHLRRCMAEVRDKWPFEITAMVVLPDHFHAIWSLPRGDCDYSTRMRRMKGMVTRAYLSEGGKETELSVSMVIRSERGVWQRRFWEHQIRDETDFERHFHYIHFNPVKHGYVQHTREWPHSSFHRYARMGHYTWDWTSPPIDEPEGCE